MRHRSEKWLVVFSVTLGCTLAGCGGEDSSSSGGHGGTPDAAKGGSSGGGTGGTGGTSTGGSSDGGPPDSASDSNELDANTPDTDAIDGAATCNDLAQLGTSLDILATQAAPPAAQGGTIVDGAYVATATKMWGSSSPEGKKVGTLGPTRLDISGTSVQGVTTGPTSGLVTRRSDTLTTSGSSLTLVVTCESPLPEGGIEPPTTGEYTATSTTLSFYMPMSGTAVYEETFTKQ